MLGSAFTSRFRAARSCSRFVDGSLSASSTAAKTEAARSARARDRVLKSADAYRSSEGFFSASRLGQNNQHGS